MKGHSLQSNIDTLARAHGIPGLALIKIKSDQPSTILVSGHVCADGFPSSHRITAQTLFPLASVSKFISACLVVALAKQKLIDLHQPLHWLDDQAGFEITLTLAQLLSQRSGFSKSVGFEGLHPGKDSLPSEIDSSVLCYSTYNPLAINRFCYSGCHFWLLQKILESELGQPYEQLLQRWLCQPLALQQTTSHAPSSTLDNVALGHDLRGRVLDGGWRLFAGVEAAAGLWTSPADLDRLLTGLLRASTACDAEAAPLLLQDLLMDGQADGYHLGVNVVRTSLGIRLSHWGINPGYQAALNIHLGLGRASAALTNFQHSDAFCNLIMQDHL